MKRRIPTSATALLVLAVIIAGRALPAGRQAYIEELSAESANVGQPGQQIRIRLFDWSSDEAREDLLSALNPPPPEPEPEPDSIRGRGGRGRGGRDSEPSDPVLAALDRATTVGFLWTDQVSGYAIRYAYHEPLDDGGQRIVLVTNRRLGLYTTAWDPVETDYAFTLIEIRLGANGQGEGKTSLTSDVVIDADAGTPALDDYGAAPPVLADVRR